MLSVVLCLFNGLLKMLYLSGFNFKKKKVAAVKLRLDNGDSNDRGNYFEIKHVVEQYQKCRTRKTGGEGALVSKTTEMWRKQN